MRALLHGPSLLHRWDIRGILEDVVDCDETRGRERGPATGALSMLVSRVGYLSCQSIFNSGIKKSEQGGEYTKTVGFRLPASGGAIFPSFLDQSLGAIN